MPEIVELRQEHSPMLFDSDTGDSLTAEKVVDITDIVPNGERTLLLFTRAKRGRIVQIAYPYEGHAYLGAYVHYFIDETSSLASCLSRMERRSQVSASAFRTLLKRYAPK